MKIRTLLAGVLLVLLASSVAHAQAWNDSATTLYVGERAYYEFTADTDSGALHVGRNGSVVYGFDQDIVGTDTDADAAIVTCATPTTVVGSCILAVDLTADVSGGIITPAHEWIRVRVDVAPGSGTAQVVLLGGEAAAVSTVSPTFTGTVTATGGFDSGPSATLGGSVDLKEPEGCTDCDAAGAGKTLRVKVFDLSNSMSTDKVWSPGFTGVVVANTVDFNTYEDGGYCLALPDAGTPLDCNGSNFKAKAGFAFVDGVAVDKVHVMISTLAGWDAAGGDDIMYLQMHVVDTTDDSETQFGDRFKIINGTTGCGTDPNCADAAGTFTWQVNRVTDLCVGANDPYDCCTAADTGADCPGVSAVAQGLLGVEIEADSNDVDADADIRLNVVFKAF